MAIAASDRVCVPASSLHRLHLCRQFSGSPPPASCAGTLAAASGQNLERLLNRNAKRQARAGGGAAPAPAAAPVFSAAATGLVPGLPAARRRIAVGACGAAAVLQQDQDESPVAQEAGGHPPRGGRDSAAAAAADEEQQQQQQQQHVSVQDGDDEDWEDAWQDEEGEEEWEDAGVGGAAGATTASAAGDSEEDDGEGGGLTITFDKGDTAGDRGKRRRPASSGGEGGARRGVTKADRERAALVHRSHLLCLLARGQLFDGAASDPLLQAQLLSLVPPGPAAKLQIGGTAAAADGSSSSSSSAACSLQGLHQQLAWFRRHFKLAALGCGAAAPSGQGDLVTAALHGTRGLEGAGAALQAAVERRVAAGAEEYAALFAALLRAQGAAVRLMVALSPSSLRPTGALGCTGGQGGGC